MQVKELYLEKAGLVWPAFLVYTETDVCYGICVLISNPQERQECMLQLNEQECWQMSTGLTRIMTASVEDFRHIVFEVLSEIAPFDCGVSYVVKNNPNHKDCLEPLAHPQAKFVPTVTEIFRAAELAHKSSAYTSMEWQNKSFIFRDSDMFSEEFLSNTEIGRMIHDEWGMSYACKIFLVHNGLLLGKFWLLRQEESGNFQEKELFRLRLLEPLVTRKMYEFHPQNDKGRYAKKVLTERFGLTDRERQITGLICRGMTNQQIADKLFCAETTVKKHISSIAKKMNVSNRTEIFHCCLMENAVQSFI